MLAGDIVEHRRGRWSGRRLTVIGISTLGSVDVLDGNGNHSTILDAGSLRVLQRPLVVQMVRAWHSAVGIDRVVLRNAFKHRRAWKQGVGYPRQWRRRSIREIENFLQMFADLSATAK